MVSESVLGYQDIKGNEKAHDLARGATQNIVLGSEPNCAVIYVAVRTTLKQRLVKLLSTSIVSKSTILWLHRFVEMN